MTAGRWVASAVGAFLLVLLTSMGTPAAYATTTTAGPVASFTVDPASGSAPLVVTLTDTSTGSPTSWSWDLGDGRTLTGAGPHSVTFDKAGDFLVTLTASNADGSSKASKTVSVASAAPVCGTKASPCYVTSTDPVAVVCSVEAPCVMEPSKLGSTAASVPLIALVLLTATQVVLAMRR